jgi:hypothetical protein
MAAFGTGFGFGLRHPGGVMPELRLFFVRLRVAVPHLEGVLEHSVSRRRAEQETSGLPANDQ